MPTFRNRLTRAKQQIYDRSSAIASIPLRASPAVFRAVAALAEALRAADHARVEYLSQAIADEIAGALKVPRVRVVVSLRRPSNARGELHGLYTPSNGPRSGSATIKVWMVTAKRGQIVAFKTFLRTLLHEICHHLDYALLRLPDSFHTEGFYKRESSLFYRIGGAQVGTDGTRSRGVGREGLRVKPPRPQALIP